MTRQERQEAMKLADRVGSLLIPESGVAYRLANFVFAYESELVRLQHAIKVYLCDCGTPNVDSVLLDVFGINGDVIEGARKASGQGPDGSGA